MLTPNTQTKCLFHSNSEVSASVKFPSTKKLRRNVCSNCQAEVVIYIPQMTVIVRRSCLHQTGFSKLRESSNRDLLSKAAVLGNPGKISILNIK